MERGRSFRKSVRIQSGKKESLPDRMAETEERLDESLLMEFIERVVKMLEEETEEDDRLALEVERRDSCSPATEKVKMTPCRRTVAELGTRTHTVHDRSDEE